MGDQRKVSISERRATYPLQERLKIYGPDTMARRFSDQEKHSGKFVLNGVNILNKNSLDSDTVMHRIKQRRETHNRVERRRRDKLNGLVEELAHSLPGSMQAEKNHRAKILKLAIDYIHVMQQENSQMKQQLGYPVDQPLAFVDTRPMSHPHSPDMSSCSSTAGDASPPLGPTADTHHELVDHAEHPSPTSYPGLATPVTAVTPLLSPSSATSASPADSCAPMPPSNAATQNPPLFGTFCFQV
ncbi:hypothetical protein BC940DRAFT_300682 [Gongronella butleri]|nr:hypothetical protein BC940DRAFT_300682 [Gongronella butleri]